MAKSTKSEKKEKVKYPEKCSSSGIGNYISEKHGITRKQSREIVDDMFDVINEGVMRGERVAIGGFGKIFIRIKPATKARKGRNPLTGEEITIPAKKAKKAPKFSFSKSFKEAATKAKVK